MTIAAEDLDYALPRESIATEFAHPRDRARMLVAPADGPCVHATVADLPRFVGPGDVIVLNATQSRASRVALIGPTGPAELIAIEPVEGTRWVARLPPGLVATAGARWEIAGAAAAVTLIEPELGDCWVVEFHTGGDPVEVLLEQHGEVPLPPYADREHVDRERARTTFGYDVGSAAPPTAGLHLTQAVIDGCVRAGATLAEVTLHVSLRTSRYQMVDPADPKLHSERFDVPPETLDALRSADRTIAIGTTVVRALETCAVTGERSGSTSIFLSRGHEFAYVDALFTCFQAPRSTMLAMIDAFAGERWKQAYAEARDGGYRFLALGDACLLTGQRPRTHR